MNAKDILSPAAVSVVVIIVLKIMRDKEKKARLLKLLTSKSFMLNLLMIIAFSYYGLSLDENDPDAKNLKEAIKTSILGMIIAFMGIVELTLAPFWILFVAAYYFGITA